MLPFPGAGELPAGARQARTAPLRVPASYLLWGQRHVPLVELLQRRKQHVWGSSSLTVLCLEGHSLSTDPDPAPLAPTRCQPAKGSQPPHREGRTFFMQFPSPNP